MACETCGAPDARGLCGLAWVCPGEEPAERRYIKPFEPFRAVCPHSEVCMHMRVAGRVMWMVLLDGYCVQLLTDGWEPFSIPILDGEAGVYQDAQGSYAYVR
jgi:hypothetical protein